MQKLFDNLNPAQHAAVTHGHGHQLILAGAGTGKTRTLVHRTAYLLEQGVPAKDIMLLTFTNRAAGEMLRRTAELLGKSCDGITGGTFHGVANILLRRYGHYIDISPRFSILDQADAERIISQNKPRCRSRRKPTKRVIMNVLSGSVNRSLPLELVVTMYYPHLLEFLSCLQETKAAYIRHKRRRNMQDFDDLLLNLCRLLKSPARKKINYQHILVDEYQDTNPIQAEIVRLLAGKQGCVTAVGDDAQSIYGFRGADVENIRQFPEVFPGCHVVKLQQNYRSTAPILNFSNAIIEKGLFSKKPGGELPVVYSAISEADEAISVVEQIQELLEYGLAPSDIAVLFRSGFHSYKIEHELAAVGISFEKRGGLRLTEAAHIKDVISFFRFLVNPASSLSLVRLLCHLDGIGPKTSKKIADAVTRQDDPFFALRTYDPAARWRKDFDRLNRLFADLRKLSRPVEIFDWIMEYYEPYFQKKFQDDNLEKRFHDLEQLREFAADYHDLLVFVDSFALEPMDSRKNGDGEQLILSTIHSAKGLEFKVVFVVGVSEGKFSFSSNQEEMEEQRRLFYVACTRAENDLYVSCPAVIMTREGKYRSAEKSFFLRGVDPDLYEIPVPEFEYAR
ncbi:MAG: ATP-dependent helicase [Candidatus Electrothrix sp. AR3]|nr:ATP-dependent helicase [Candidatus Electrothrix sp. AR3]